VDAAVNAKIVKLQNLTDAADGFLTEADQGKPKEGAKQVAQDVDASVEASVDAAVNAKIADLSDAADNVDDFLAKADGQPGMDKDDPRKVPTSVRNKARAYPALARLAVALGKPDPRCPALQRPGRSLLQAIERPGNCSSCCYCPPTYYYNGQDLVPCPVDEYCPGGWFPYGDLQASSAPEACPAGIGTCSETGASSTADCACSLCDPACGGTTPICTGVDTCEQCSESRYPAVKSDCPAIQFCREDGSCRVAQCDVDADCGGVNSTAPACDDSMCAPATSPSPPLYVQMSSTVAGLLLVTWHNSTDLGSPQPLNYTVVCVPAPTAAVDPCFDEDVPGRMQASSPVGSATLASLFQNVTQGANYSCFVGLSNAEYLNTGGSVCAPATCVDAFCSQDGTVLVVVTSEQDSPRNVTAASTAASNVTVTWNEAVVATSITNYTVTCVTSEFAVYATDPCNATSNPDIVFAAKVPANNASVYSYAFTGMRPGTNYYCFVGTDVAVDVPGYTKCVSATPIPVYVRECDISSQCSGTRPTCTVGPGTCVACSPQTTPNAVQGTCPDGNQFCRVGGSCAAAQCSTTADCGGSTPVCSGGTCTACSPQTTPNAVQGTCPDGNQFCRVGGSCAAAQCSTTADCGGSTPVCSGGTCTCTTPPNCATPGAACFGSSSQLTCSTCAAGFALNATANTCTACTTPPNCATPGAACFDSSSQLMCTTCAAGFALNATANTCTGCTTNTTTTATTSTITRVGSQDAVLPTTPFAAQCPTNQIVVGIGVSLETRNFVRYFNVKCATFDAASATYGTPSTYGSATTINAMCPAGTQLTGILARPGEILNAIGAICRPIDWTASSASSTLGPFPNGPATGPSCPVGQVITGLSGRTILYYGGTTASAVVATCARLSCA
jgi:hypothetical protein